MRKSLTITLVTLAILAFVAFTTDLTANAQANHGSTHITVSHSHLRAIVSHNPPRIVVTQPTTRRNCGAILANSNNQPCVKTLTLASAPPKFGPVLFSGDVQQEKQLSVPARFTVSLMCDGGTVSYTLVDLGGDVTGLPGMPIEHRTITCDNTAHVLTYSLPLSDNVSILVSRLTTVTVKVA